SSMSRGGLKNPATVVRLGRGSIWLVVVQCRLGCRRDWGWNWARGNAGPSITCGVFVTRYARLPSYAAQRLVNPRPGPALAAAVSSAKSLNIRGKRQEPFHQDF